MYDIVVELKYLQIIHQRFVAHLAERYNNGEAREIANWCDDILDRSGRLLGEVREAARTDPLQSPPRPDRKQP